MKKFDLPQGFQEIVHDFSREVLRDQPADIIDFAHEYFKAKDEGLDFDYPKKGKNIPPVESRKTQGNFTPAEEQQFISYNTIYRQGRTEESRCES
jgi:hypothetical protein